MRWTSNVAPPARPCLATRSATWARLSAQTAPWRPGKQDCILHSEGDEQRCCGKLSRGRTLVLACHGATSACVESGTESLALMAEHVCRMESGKEKGAAAKCRTRLRNTWQHTRTPWQHAPRTSAAMQTSAPRTQQKVPVNRIYQAHTHTYKLCNPRLKCGGPLRSLPLPGPA